MLVPGNEPNMLLWRMLRIRCPDNAMKMLTCPLYILSVQESACFLLPRGPACTSSARMHQLAYWHTNGTIWATPRWQSKITAFFDVFSFVLSAHAYQYRNLERHLGLKLCSQCLDTVLAKTHHSHCCTIAVSFIVPGSLSATASIQMDAQETRERILARPIPPGTQTRSSLINTIVIVLMYGWGLAERANLRGSYSHLLFAWPIRELAIR
jgi:hypothetical protein